MRRPCFSGQIPVVAVFDVGAGHLLVGAGHQLVFHQQLDVADGHLVLFTQAQCHLFGHLGTIGQILDAHRFGRLGDGLDDPHAAKGHTAPIPFDDNWFHAFDSCEIGKAGAANGRHRGGGLTKF